MLTVMDSVVQARPDWPGFLPQLENRPELMVTDRLDPDSSGSGWALPMPPGSVPKSGWLRCSG